MEKDVAIIGVGPAGLQAAIHASRRKASVVAIGKIERSGMDKAHIENYCCADRAKDGHQMLEEGKRQARRFGTEIVEEDVVEIKRVNNKFEITTESGLRVMARALIIATGISRKMLGIKGEKEFLGRGVSYCADCDANFFRDKRVAVIGGESAGASSAVLLSSYATEVNLIAERLDVADAMIEKLKASNVNIIEGKKVKEILGDNAVNSILFEDGSILHVDGVFIELGSKGVLELTLNIGLIQNENGYIETDKQQRTSVEGIFAAGDVCGPPFQVAKAVGEGCVAGIKAAEYAKEH